MAILEIPFGNEGWKKIRDKVYSVDKSRRGEALKKALGTYVMEYLIDEYGEDVAGRLWWEEALDYQLVDIANRLIKAFREGKILKVLKFEVERLPRGYKEGVDRMKRGCCLRESVRRMRGRLRLGEAGKKKWIQDGAFRSWCEERGFSGVNNGCIKKAKQVAKEKGDTTLLRRAIAAENMLKASGVIK